MSIGELVHMSPIDRSVRKRNGVYYTPPDLVAHVVQQTLGPILKGRTPEELRDLRILDPACGAGAFLLGVYDYLLDWYRQFHGRTLTTAERERILLRHIYGVEVDPEAVEIARRVLVGKVRDGERGCASAPRTSTRLITTRSSGRLRNPARRSLDGNVRPGNALVAPDFDPAGIAWDGPYTVVIGNPPWGQKAIGKDPVLKRYLRLRYPSSAGIFDLFRPFVELAVRLTADGGRFAMVLPDIILLKDYPQTRCLLLDTLALDRIDWWGMAFPGATIDTATLIGTKRPAPIGHRVAVAVHDNPPLAHTIPQDDFRANPRHVFNLHLTAGRRRLLSRLKPYPRLGELFEIHEGVHSGNLRSELFVDSAVDTSCRELLFGRDEIGPYSLRWNGRYVRLGVLPRMRTPERYANAGRPEWYEKDKILIRRTGDRVLAAVDRERRYVSNNFFLAFPKGENSLDLDGLCALLNSRFMTGYFRTVEPRRGRAFAELKIKHLRDFPLPLEGQRLNELGRRRLGEPGLDREIDAVVEDLFGITEEDRATLGDLAGGIE